MTIWTFIKLRPFFEKLAKSVKDPYHKVAGKSTRGMPISFSDQEKEKINAAIQRLADEFKLK